MGILLLMTILLPKIILRLLPRMIVRLHLGVIERVLSQVHFQPGFVEIRRRRFPAQVVIYAIGHAIRRATLSIAISATKSIGNAIHVRHVDGIRDAHPGRLAFMSAATKQSKSRDASSTLRSFAGGGGGGAVLVAAIGTMMMIGLIVSGAARRRRRSFASDMKVRQLRRNVHFRKSIRSRMIQSGIGPTEQSRDVHLQETAAAAVVIGGGIGSGYGSGVDSTTFGGSGVDDPSDVRGEATKWRRSVQGDGRNSDAGKAGRGGRGRGEMREVRARREVLENSDPRGRWRLRNVEKRKSDLKKNMIHLSTLDTN